MKSIINKTGFFIVCVLMFVYGLNFVSAELPKEEPLWTIGEDYLVVYNQDPLLYVLFDNTEINQVIFDHVN